MTPYIMYDILIFENICFLENLAKGARLGWHFRERLVWPWSDSAYNYYIKALLPLLIHFMFLKFI